MADCWQAGLLILEAIRKLFVSWRGKVDGAQW
jgi:hypothetical protein